MTAASTSAETTVETYRTRLRDYVTPALGRRKLSQLGKADVLRVIDACHAAEQKDWSTHGVPTALQAVLRFARERDYMSADPFQGVPRDRLPAQKASKKKQVLRPTEAALLLDALRRKQPASVSLRDYVLGCLVCDAGMRISEACGFTWGDAKLMEQDLQVEGQLAPLKRGAAPRIVPPKSHNGYRTVALMPRLQAALEELYAGEDDAAFVLRTQSGRPLNRHNAARSIREAAKAAGLGHVTPQVLRRTLGTALSDCGRNEAASAAMMGHTVEVYHGEYVLAQRDKLERDAAREALVAHGFGTLDVTPT